MFTHSRSKLRKTTLVERSP